MIGTLIYLHVTDVGLDHEAGLLIENPFLILSILSGVGAAAVLLYGILYSKLRSVAHADLAGGGQLAIEPRSEKGAPNVLDRITLLSRNLVQCPSCLAIDFANIRFCCKCGMQVHGYSESPGGDTQTTVTQYLSLDGSTRVAGFSMRVDPKTRIGVIVGVQNQEPLEQVEQARS